MRAKRDRGLCSGWGCQRPGVIRIIPSLGPEGWYLVCAEHWSTAGGKYASFAEIVAAGRNKFTYDVVNQPLQIDTVG